MQVVLQRFPRGLLPERLGADGHDDFDHDRTAGDQRLIDALRAVMLEGASLADIAGRLIILAGWALGTFTLALRWFRWR